MLQKLNQEFYDFALTSIEFNLVGCIVLTEAFHTYILLETSIFIPSHYFYDVSVRLSKTS